MGIQLPSAIWLHGFRLSTNRDKPTLQNFFELILLYLCSLTRTFEGHEMHFSYVLNSSWCSQIERRGFSTPFRTFVGAFDGAPWLFCFAIKIFDLFRKGSLSAGFLAFRLKQRVGMAPFGNFIRRRILVFGLSRRLSNKVYIITSLQLWNDTLTNYYSC